MPWLISRISIDIQILSCLILAKTARIEWARGKNPVMLSSMDNLRFASSTAGPA